MFSNTLPLGYVLKSKLYNYRIEKILGQGSFGITYLAKIELQGDLGYLESCIHVTIKEFFMKEISGREGTTVTSSTNNKGCLFYEYKEKFAREAKNLSRLKHHNIVNVMELFEANNTCYYVMEYLSGGDLDSLIEHRGKLTEEDTLKYTRQIGEALSFMHQNKMLHLDLKPKNVMLNANDEAILIDFGLSKQYDKNGEPESSTTVGRGTPGYAPLEQANYQDGHGFPVTMDVYALGATMYKMLIGKRAPEASVILNEGFPKDIFKSIVCSNNTLDCIIKAMSPLKKDRFSCVEVFLNTLYQRNDEKTIDNRTATIKSRKRKNQQPSYSASYISIPVKNGVSIEMVRVDKKNTDNSKTSVKSNEDNESKIVNKREYKVAIITVVAIFIILGVCWFLYSNGGINNNSEAKTQQTIYSDSNIRIPVKNGVCIDMVRVEAGTFMMGATPEMKNPGANEKPVHQVTLTNDYYIGKYEVTQALWKVVMENNPSNLKGDDLPVEGISWDDSQEFINKLNNITDKKFRLPTEAEWEYAARGGNKSRGYQYSGSNNLSDVAWYTDNSGIEIHPVGSKQANELGIYDMSGNVLEWCQDRYGSYSSSSLINLIGSMINSYRVYRGFKHSSWRNGIIHDTPVCTLGLRIVLSE